jgi:hypothetical protein
MIFTKAAIELAGTLAKIAVMASAENFQLAAMAQELNAETVQKEH